MSVQGVFLWNGVRALMSASYTLSLGVTPGVATLAIPPQPNGVQMQGTLTIQYGTTKIQFPDCRVGKIDFHADGSGRKYWLLHILDGRWRWRFGIAKAWQNRRLTNGFLDPEGRSRPQELAKMLADAVGIKNLDVSEIDNNTFPFADWEWRERPDLLLEQLCESFGCRMCYNANGKARVVRLGKGVPIPTTNALEYQKLLDPAEIPTELTFVAGRSVWNADIPLEAVGEEPTSEIRPIDKLSYKPVGGWGISDPPRFTCLELVNPKLQQFAQRSVFRWYRPKLPFMVGPHKVEHLWQILPWNNYQLVPTDNMAAVGQYSKDSFMTQPVWGWGRWLKHHENFRPVFVDVAGNLVRVSNDIVISGIGIDTERGIVQFSETMLLIDAKGWRVPAEMKVRVATSVRDYKTRAFHHWTKTRKIGPTGTKPAYIVREEIAYRSGRDVISGPNFGKEFNNEEDLESAAKYALDQAMYQFQLQAPEVATLPGFVPAMTDGAIQQVRWSVDESGRPTTFIARNTEWSPPGGTWSERRYYQDTMLQASHVFRSTSAQRF